MTPILLVIVICVLLLAATLFVVEWHIRTRDARRTEQQRKAWDGIEGRIRATLAAEGRQDVLADVLVRATAQQTQLDHICSEVARELQAPAAVITMVERDGQRWLANSGSDWCEIMQADGDDHLPLTGSYCKYVVTTDQPMVITDSELDVRLKDIDTGTLHKVRAYIGEPVHTTDDDGKQVAVGSLCVFDMRPRDWTYRERAKVKSYASLVKL